MPSCRVDLGFAEDCEDYWRLLSHYFPSKLGGPPAWLSLSGVPDYDQLKCLGCGETCRFLLQIYAPAPLDDVGNGDSAIASSGSGDVGLDDAFHRTLYLFVCAKPSCPERSFLCFRSQLPRDNEFYSSSPPNEDRFDESSSYPKVSDFTKICRVCHCSATKTCAKCKTVSYCSKGHQSLDWRSGHKEACSTQLSGEAKHSRCKYFFDEYEIVIEEEVRKSSTVKAEQDRLKDYESYVKSLKTDEDLSTPAASSELQSLAEPKIGDAAFLEFRERIADHPDQIIRYDKGGSPLLVSSETRPPQPVPSCSCCGGQRVFEFQVMPQALSYLKVDTSMDSLDWGTLLIYTCENSCHVQGYADEFVWKQDFSSKDVVEGVARK